MWVVLTVMGNPGWDLKIGQVYASFGGWSIFLTRGNLRYGLPFLLPKLSIDLRAEWNLMATAWFLSLAWDRCLECSRYLSKRSNWFFLSLPNVENIEEVFDSYSLLASHLRGVSLAFRATPFFKNVGPLLVFCVRNENEVVPRIPGHLAIDERRLF